MALSNKICIKAKEQKYKSIAQFNAENKQAYYLFNPKNVTAFKCRLGFEDQKLKYIYERLECMWSNEIIEQYILLDDYCIEKFNALQSEKTINKVQVADNTYYYTLKKTIIGRWVYNVVLTINDVHYYLRIRTIKQRKFFQLMKEFLQEQTTLNN